MNEKYYTLSDGAKIGIRTQENGQKTVSFFGNMTKTRPNGSHLEKQRLAAADIPESDILLVGACFIGPHVQFDRTYNVLLRGDGSIVVITKGNDKAVPVQPVGSESYYPAKKIASNIVPE